MHKNKSFSSFLSILIIIPMIFTNLLPGEFSNRGNRVDSKDPAYVPGVVLVGLKPGVTLEDGLPDTAGRFNTNAQSMDASLRSLHVRSSERLFPSAKDEKDPPAGNNGKVPLGQIRRLHLPANADVQAAIQALRADPNVEFAEPDYIAYASDEIPTSTDTTEPTSTEPSTPTETPQPVSTETSTPTDTPEPTSANTSTLTATTELTSTNTLSPTDTLEPTSTITSTLTGTLIPSGTNTPTPTGTPLPTSTKTLAPTKTSTPTNTTTASAMPVSMAGIIEDDPLYSVQWGLTKINIAGAWDDTHGSPSIIIAVLDSGLDQTHVDLAAHLWVNPGEIPGNGVDDDSNGYIDDVNGWNFVTGSNDPSDDNGHGTLVAGVAAAIGGNGQGIVGVCPECTLMPVKVMGASGTANYSDIAAGVLYAAQKGARVINLSLGGYADSNTLRNAIETATSTYGVVVVASAGNDNLDQAFYPAAYDNVLAVAGTDSADLKLDFSNYAAWVDVSAPARDIRTTALGGDWVNGSGTSMAAPFAAGLAGLIWTLHPDWSQSTVRSQIVHTTDNIDSLNPAYTGLLGSGRLNAGTAMQAPHPLLSMASYSINGQADGKPVLGGTASLTVTLQNDWWDAAGVTATLTETDPYVTILTGSAGYGDIPAGTTKTNPTAFTFSVSSGAGYNHPIPFNLSVTETSGYSNSFNFTVNTETGVVNKSGTLTTQTWTSDKTYLITNTVNIPAGVTLTIQPGTTVKFNGNYSLNVRGTLLADGSSSQPILFRHNTTGTWGNILFDDTSTDASTDGAGNYLSGSILRYVTIQASTGGIDCTTATPYLSHVDLDAGGVVCSLGATPVWLLDSTLTGGASFTGPGSALRNTITGNLGISAAGAAQSNVVSGSLTLGSGTASGNTVTGGALTVSGSTGSISDNSVTGGNLTAGTTFSVLRNTITGGLTAGNGSTVDHNTVSSGGITAGSSAILTWNSVEGASGVGLAAGSNVTAQYNRLVGNVTGMTATTGLIEHNLIANNNGVGLRVGAATLRYNTFTGNQGDTIVVQGGNPVAITDNNLEGNTGTYDLVVNIASGVTVLAENNWWGTTNNLAIAGRIYDWNDDDLKAIVSYSLKLTTPDPTAPGYVRGVTVLPDTMLGIQTGTFDVDFSRPMDVNGTPWMSFQHIIPWATRKSMPTARNVLGVAAGSNGKIYAIGGCGASYCVATVEEYDPATDTWRTRASMPTARGWLGVAAGSNGRIYAIGGNIGSYYLSTVEEYDPDTDTWTTRASMPTARYGLGVAAASNGRIYAIGGININGDYLATVEEYDPETDTWTTRASMPTARMALGVAAGSNGRIYAIGGDNGSYLSTVEEFDPATDTWTTRASMPTARGYLGVAAASNGRIYAIGGCRHGGCVATVEEYDPVADTWTTQASIPTAGWEAFGVVAGSNGRIYAIGGYDGGGYSGTVKEFTIPFGADFYASEWLSETQFRSSYDITSAIPKGVYRITVSDVIDTDGMQIVPNSNTTFTVDYAGSVSDTTPPTRPVVTASGNGTLTTLSAGWSSSDPDSAITMYRYAIGTSPGGQEVINWTTTSATSMTRTSLILTPGRFYYVAVQARNEGGLWSQAGVSNAVIALVAPANLLASDGTYTDKVRVSWTASSGATSYQVYRATSGTTTKSLLGNPAGTAFGDTTAIPGVAYFYWVKACNGATCSKYSLANTGWRNLSIPANLLASDGSYTTKVRLTWTASYAATSYRVYRATSAAGSKSLLGSPAGTAFDDTLATPGVTYYYWVRACHGACSAYSTYNTGWRNLSAPANLLASDGTYTSLVRVSWTASSGATSYLVYRAASASGTKSLLGSRTGTTFDDTTATPGVTYTYWVRAIKSAIWSNLSVLNTGWRKLSPPTNVQASDGTYTDKVRVSWTASLWATSYQVYRATSGTTTKSLLGSPAGTAFGDITATPGVTYYYWVKACNGANCSNYSASNTGWRNLSAPTNVQASDGIYTDKVRVSWTASSGATSYKLYRATSTTDPKSLLGSLTGITFYDSTATPGLTYYYWVVAYRGTILSISSAYDTGWRKP